MTTHYLVVVAVIIDHLTVLSRPPLRDQFSGFGASLLQHGGFGPGAGQSFEQQFGIISVLTLKQGVNSFSIKGLGDFTSLRDLAGHGIAVSTQSKGRKKEGLLDKVHTLPCSYPPKVVGW